MILQTPTDCLLGVEGSSSIILDSLSPHMYKDVSDVSPDLQKELVGTSWSSFLCSENKCKELFSFMLSGPWDHLALIHTGLSVYWQPHHLRDHWWPLERAGGRCGSEREALQHPGSIMIPTHATSRYHHSWSIIWPTVYLILAYLKRVLCH